MKSILITAIIVLVWVIAAQAKPIRDIISLKEPVLETEEYVNDIPFDTRLVASENMLILDGWEMKEEPYVDDIPFDTRAIAGEAMLERMVGASQEAEIDDIPFNTRKVFEECLMARLMRDYKSELSASDISFDTKGITAERLLASLTTEYREEQEISDIPYETVCIISTSYDTKPSYVVLRKKTMKKSDHKKHSASGYDYTIIQPRHIDYSAPVPAINTLTRDLMVTPDPSL